MPQMELWMFKTLCYLTAAVTGNLKLCKYEGVDKQCSQTL